MQSYNKETWDQFVILLGKLISIPALLALFIKIAIQVKRKQATILGALTSLFVGLTTVFLTKPLIYDYVKSDSWRTAAIAFIAIMADKIAEYLILKANVDKFFDTIGAGIISVVKKWFNKK